MTARKILFVATIAIAGLGSACIGPASQGSFDQTLEVSGTTRLEVFSGEGSARITPGAANRVHIHGEFRVRAWPWENSRQRALEISRHPPIHQDGGLIRVGLEGIRYGALDANYLIEAPEDTEVRAINGSGNINITGIAGPLNLVTGSGGVTANQVQGNVRATAGSGEIRLEGVQGSAEVSAGSGDVELDKIGGEVRVITGSGEITVSGPGRTVTLRNGSGAIHVVGASNDLRVRTGSGNVTIDGSPSAGSYWELRTASGDVGLNVPSNAAFRFDASTHTGDIRSSLPLMIVERSAHELRAVIGQGTARVEVQSGSGDIQLKSLRP